MIETFKIIHNFYDPETVCSLFTLNECGNKKAPLQAMHEDSFY